MFSAVVMTPDIYHVWYTWMMLWEDNFTLVNITNSGKCNVRQYREIKNGEQYTALDICWEDWLSGRYGSHIFIIKV